MEFTAVKLVKVTWQFCFRCSIHRLQLPFYLTPEALYGVAVCSSVGVNEVFRVVDHQVDVAYIVQVKVWRELVWNNHSTRQSAESKFWELFFTITLLTTDYFMTDKIRSWFWWQGKSRASCVKHLAESRVERNNKLNLRIFVGLRPNWTPASWVEPLHVPTLWH